MKPSQQSVSAQPVLLFNPRLTAGSPYTPSTRKLGKEYTKDELELMRLELAKDLEKEEATPLSEDPAAVEQRREEELRAFAGSGGRGGRGGARAGAGGLRGAGEGTGAAADMEAYARSCEKQSDDASVPPALPCALGDRRSSQGSQRSWSCVSSSPNKRMSNRSNQSRSSQSKPNNRSKQSNPNSNNSKRTL